MNHHVGDLPTVSVPLYIPQIVDVRVNVFIRHNAEVVADLNVVVERISPDEAPGVLKNVAAVCTFDDSLFSHSRRHSYGFSKADGSEEPSHSDHGRGSAVVVVVVVVEPTGRSMTIAERGRVRVPDMRVSMRYLYWL